MTSSSPRNANADTHSHKNATKYPFLLGEFPPEIELKTSTVRKVALAVLRTGDEDQKEAMRAFLLQRPLLSNYPVLRVRDAASGQWRNRAGEAQSTQTHTQSRTQTHASSLRFAEHAHLLGLSDAHRLTLSLDQAMDLAKFFDAPEQQEEPAARPASSMKKSGAKKTDSRKKSRSVRFHLPEDEQSPVLALSQDSASDDPESPTSVSHADRVLEMSEICAH